MRASAGFFFGQPGNKRKAGVDRWGERTQKIMKTPIRPAPFTLLLACLVTPSTFARAELPDDDETLSPDRPLADLPGFESPVPDLFPSFLPMLVPPPLGHAAVSLSVSMRSADDRSDIAGSVILEFPFEALGSSKAKNVTVEKHQNEHDDVADNEDTAESADGESVSRRGDPRKTRKPPPDRHALPIVKPEDARAAIAASKRRRGTAAVLDDLDGLASRARYASLLPTLRVRATRLVDESISLSPTSYDADRTTSRGGASLWLEARATWSLDRLVFASEEVRVTQIQRDVADEQESSSQKVVERLFAWQRAVYAMFDPSLTIPRCVQLWLEAEELAASLDIETGGWFERWRARQGATPMPSCVQSFGEDAATMAGP